jgi:hypothetical protein
MKERKKGTNKKGEKGGRKKKGGKWKMEERKKGKKEKEKESPRFFNPRWGKKVKPDSPLFGSSCFR